MIGSPLSSGPRLIEGELVATQMHATRGAVPERPEDRILGTGQIGRNVVVEGEGPTRQVET